MEIYTVDSEDNILSMTCKAAYLHAFCFMLVHYKNTLVMEVIRAAIKQSKQNIVSNYLVLEESIDPNIVPEVQGTAYYDLLSEANGTKGKNIRVY